MFIASYLANETALPTINLLHLSSKKALTAALQMAEVASAIADGGRLMEPHLTKRIVDAEGRTVKRVSAHAPGSPGA